MSNMASRMHLLTERSAPKLVYYAKMGILIAGIFSLLGLSAGDLFDKSAGKIVGQISGQISISSLGSKTAPIPTRGNSNTTPRANTSGNPDTTWKPPSTCGSRSVEIVYQWKKISYRLPTGYRYDESFLRLGAFISGVDPLPTNRLLIMTPRDASRTPATLSTVSLYPNGSDISPVLEPYPDLAWNTLDVDNPKCNETLVSVQRTTRDSCNRLWALDSGTIMAFFKPKIVCPPKIVIFDLTTNKAVRTIHFPESVLTPISILTNIRTDADYGTCGSASSCDDTYVYITDSASSSLIVHKSPGDTFYTISHPYFHPDPDNYNITVEGEQFHYFQGVLGLGLGGSGPSRLLYLQVPASLLIYSVPTSALQRGPVDETYLPIDVVLKKTSESSDLFVDQTDGCLLYNPVTQGSIVAYDPVTRIQSIVATDPKVITIMENYNQLNSQTVFGASSRVQKLLNKDVNFSEVNNYILKISLQTIY